MKNDPRIDEINFRLAIDAGNIGTWRRDLATNLIVQSPATSRILGHGEGETVIPFDRLFTYTHKDDLAKFGPELEAKVASGEPFDVEFRVWRPDGTLRWITVRGKTLCDEAGKPEQVVGVMFDITEQRQAAERFRLLTEHSPDAILVGVRRHVVYANPAAARLLGFGKPDEFVGRALADFFGSECRQVVDALDDSIDEAGRASDLHELRGRRADGAAIDVQAVFGFFYWDGQPATQVMLRDVTVLKASQRQVEHLRNRLALIVEGTGDGIWEWDIAHDSFLLSGGFNKIVGRTHPEFAVTTADLYDCIHPDDLAAVHGALEECVRDKQPLDGCEFRVRSKDHGWKWVRARGVVVEEEADGRARLMAGTLSDITIRKESDELAWKHAHLDALTSLPNRRLFNQSLRFDIQKCAHADCRLALLYVDLDGFKLVNDLYGHEVGDQLLVEAAARIRACVTDADTVARFGADEFAVALTNLGRLDQVELVCQDILAALSRPFDLKSHRCYVSASVGVGFYPFDATDAEELVSKAEQAELHAKKTGRNRFAYYTSELDARAHERLGILDALRLALAHSQLEVHYQPIVDIGDNRIVKAEALLRWNHPVLGRVSPGVFIPLAEEFGLIVSIGEWMCREAVDFCKECEPVFGPGFQIGINMSPIQFMADTEALDLARYLDDAALAGDRVVIEITEGVLLNRSDKVQDRFDGFRRAGIQIALDDFGTGYSSMSYLRKFDIDYIKIDQSFVRDLPNSYASRAIAEAIIVMAHRLNKKVIAEGIETRQQLEWLAGAGCDYGQGFLFSQALPGRTFIGRPFAM